MQKEKIQEFTRRVSQDNRTSLIVTMYDIMLTYLDEAKAALEAEDREDLKPVCAMRTGYWYSFRTL